MKLKDLSYYDKFDIIKMPVITCINCKHKEKPKEPELHVFKGIRGLRYQLRGKCNGCNRVITKLTTKYFVNTLNSAIRQQRSLKYRNQ